MSAANKVERPEQLRINDPDAELERRYDRWFRKTGDPVAAATLTLASVQAGHQPASDAAALPIEQAAGLLGVSKSKLYELCKTGEMPHTKVGRRVTITPAQIDEYRAQAQEQQRPDALRYV